MANAVDICNLALANLGDVADITSLDPPEGSAQAERCAQFYSLAVSTLLESYEWGFATVRETLVRYSENNRNNWRFCYAQPAKCIRVIDLNDGPFPQKPPEFAKCHYDYEIGLNDNGRRCIYTNLDNACIRYIADIDEYLFPANFVMALSWKLAGMLAGPLIKGDSGAQMTVTCEKTYAYWIEKAISLDAAQHREFRESVPDWIARR
jgi:hypothetical protein